MRTEPIYQVKWIGLAKADIDYLLKSKVLYFYLNSNHIYILNCSQFFFIEHYAFMRLYCIRRTIVIFFKFYSV